MYTSLQFTPFLKSPVFVLLQNIYYRLKNGRCKVSTKLYKWIPAAKHTSVGAAPMWSHFTSKGTRKNFVSLSQYSIISHAVSTCKLCITKTAGYLWLNCSLKIQWSDVLDSLLKIFLEWIHQCKSFVLDFSLRRL